MKSEYQKEVQRIKTALNNHLVWLKSAIPAYDFANKVAKSWSDNQKYINDYKRWANVSIYSIPTCAKNIDISIGLAKRESIKKDGFIFLDEILNVKNVKWPHADFGIKNTIYYLGTEINIEFISPNCTYKEVTRTEKVLVCG